MTAGAGNGLSLVKWNEELQYEYERLKHWDIRPTRGADVRTLIRMGIKDDVEAFFTRLGMKGIMAINKPIYPKLVRQFLSGCTLTFRNQSTKAEDEIFTFFLHRKLYVLSINEFCDVYGFPHNTETELRRIPQERELWNTIASTRNGSETARIPEIRNPALRVIMTILGQTLFIKRRCPEISGEELTLLYHGIKHLVPEIPGPCEFNINLGSILARNLMECQYSQENGYRNLHCGTILTPLFEYLGIDLTNQGMKKEPKIVDIGFLCRSEVMLSNRDYRVKDEEGKEWIIDLPPPNLICLNSRRNLRFLPPLEN